MEKYASMSNTENMMNMGNLESIENTDNIESIDKICNLDDTDCINDTDNKGLCCTGKHKTRSEQEKRDLMNRLKRIEGQVRGVEGMLESDCYCIDILMQVSAVSAALNSFSKVLLIRHLKTCVADNIKAGNDEVVDELVKALQKLMK